MIAKLFAVRLGAEDIGVYEIQPGLIETDMTEPSRTRIAAASAKASRWRSAWACRPTSPPSRSPWRPAGSPSAPARPSRPTAACSSPASEVARRDGEAAAGSIPYAVPGPSKGGDRREGHSRRRPARRVSCLAQNACLSDRAHGVPHPSAPAQAPSAARSAPGNSLSRPARAKACMATATSSPRWLRASMAAVPRSALRSIASIA